MVHHTIPSPDGAIDEVASRKTDGPVLASIL